MYYLVYDASGELRYESHSWHAARKALGLIISETPEPSTTEGCPRLFIGPDPERMIRAMEKEGCPCPSRPSPGKRKRAARRPLAEAIRDMGRIRLFASFEKTRPLPAMIG